MKDLVGVKSVTKALIEASESPLFIGRSSDGVSETEGLEGEYCPEVVGASSNVQTVKDGVTITEGSVDTIIIQQPAKKKERRSAEKRKTGNKTEAGELARPEPLKTAQHILFSDSDD